MKQYLDMCRYILEHGEDRPDRTGTGTRSVFGYQTRYDLREGFPLLTTKKMYLRPIAEELLWFIKGDTNIKYLVDRNVKICLLENGLFFKESISFTNWSEPSLLKLRHCAP